ncbi:MAG: hypothetical protein KGY41_01170, partial [Desulfovermiculus sp.]|nr:hypothetical protein [Desulfovermiculus sp.]
LLLVRETSPLPVLLADRYQPGSGMLQILVLGIYACFVGHKLLNTAQTARIRSRVWAFFSVVFFAQLLLGLAGIPSMLMPGELHAPVPALILTCTLCGDCVGQCPNGLIGYRFPGLNPEQARTAFVVLIVSIHTLFLGVARI